MPKVEQCAKCGSSSVIRRAMLVSRYGEEKLAARVDADPAGVIFKKSARSLIHAWICGQCGYMELYAENPAELYEAFTTAQSSVTNLA